MRHQAARCSRVPLITARQKPMSAGYKRRGCAILTLTMRSIVPFSENSDFG